MGQKRGILEVEETSESSQKRVKMRDLESVFRSAGTLKFHCLTLSQFSNLKDLRFDFITTNDLLLMCLMLNVSNQPCGLCIFDLLLFLYFWH